jgi:hypothetical protein
MKTSAFIPGLLLAACAPDVPKEPTWVADVQPIVQGNCTRCHGNPQSGGTPTTFRLDVYQDTRDGRLTSEGTVRLVRGAGTMAEFMATRVVHDDDPMPPLFPLTDRQQEILTQWFATTPDKEPRPQQGAHTLNHKPFAFVVSPVGNRRSDQDLPLVIEVRDQDGDRVVGQLLFGSGGADDTVIEPNLHDGRVTVIWDTGVVPEGTYRLHAQLDDGFKSDKFAENDVALGDVVIEHPGKNTAPTATFVTPAPDTIIAKKDSPFTIKLRVSEPDAGDEATVNLSAIRGDEEITVGTLVVKTPGEVTFAWDTTRIPDAPNWRLRARVTDDDAERVVTSDYFLVSHVETNETYETIREVFESHCLICHPGKIPGLDDYDTSYPSLVRRRGLIYRRAVQKREMPPVSAHSIFAIDETLPLDEATVKRISEWLLGGTPEK